MSVLLVGELNPYGVAPSFALFHLPRHASGNRLREHLGLTDVQYRKIAKVNLCTGRWDKRSAKESAWNILVTAKYRVIVLLGSKVRQAFDGPKVFHTMDGPGHVLVGLPHPSGLCRKWNEPGAREKARALLLSIAPEIYA